MYGTSSIDISQTTSSIPFFSPSIPFVLLPFSFFFFFSYAFTCRPLFLSSSSSSIRSFISDKNRFSILSMRDNYKHIHTDISIYIYLYTTAVSVFINKTNYLFIYKSWSFYWIERLYLLSLLLFPWHLQHPLRNIKISKDK